MREWKKVTSAREVADGQRIRYEGEYFASGYGEEVRVFRDGTGVDARGNMRTTNLFRPDWRIVEALFDDGRPVLWKNGEEVVIDTDIPKAPVNPRDIAPVFYDTVFVTVLAQLAGKYPDTVNANIIKATEYAEKATERRYSK